MPIKKSRLTGAEYQDHRARLLRLGKMGIPTGSIDDPPHDPELLTLEQVYADLGKLHELPWGEIAVSWFAGLTVLRSGGLIIDSEIRTPWGDVLDLGVPTECSYYDDLISGWPEFPPKFLNHWLTHHVPLRPRREEGAIFAMGRGSVPSEYHDHHPVAVKLFLKDQRRNKLCFDFRVRVDRIVKHKYERRQAELRKRSTKRVPIFKREDGQLENQEKPSSSQTPYMSMTHASLLRLQKLKLQEQQEEAELMQRRV